MQTKISIVDTRHVQMIEPVHARRFVRLVEEFMKDLDFYWRYSNMKIYVDIKITEIDAEVVVSVVCDDIDYQDFVSYLEDWYIIEDLEVDKLGRVSGYIVTFKLMGEKKE